MNSLKNKYYKAREATSVKSLKEKYNKVRGLTSKRQENLVEKLQDTVTEDEVKRAIAAFKTQEGVTKEGLYEAFKKAQKNPENFKKELDEAVEYMESIKNLHAEDIKKNIKEKAYRASLVLRHALALKALEVTAPVYALTVPVNIMAPGVNKMPISKMYFGALRKLKGDTRRMLGLNRQERALQNLANRAKMATRRNNNVRVKYESFSSKNLKNNNNPNNKGKNNGNNKGNNNNGNKNKEE